MTEARPAMVVGTQAPIIWFCAKCHLNKPPKPERTLIELAALFLEKQYRAG